MTTNWVPVLRTRFRNRPESISLRSNIIAISSTLARKCGLTAGMHIAICYDATERRIGFKLVESSDRNAYTLSCERYGAGVFIQTSSLFKDVVWLKEALRLPMTDRRMPAKFDGEFGIWYGTLPRS